MKKGQINLESNAGSLIYKTVLQEDVVNILELGTWNGMGSTQCVIQALKDGGKTANFISIELYPEMHDEAISNLGSDLDYVTLLKGRIINQEEFLGWMDHSKINIKGCPHAKLWYQKDFDYLKSAKDLSDQIQDEIDLLILDGGEYSTYPEWQKLQSRVKYVFLDDTNVLKCRKIREELLKSKQYQIIEDDLGDRNGYSLFKNNR
jgi:hypothetical protein